MPISSGLMMYGAVLPKSENVPCIITVSPRWRCHSSAVEAVKSVGVVEVAIATWRDAVPTCVLVATRVQADTANRKTIEVAIRVFIQPNGGVDRTTRFLFPFTFLLLPSLRVLSRNIG